MGVLQGLRDAFMDSDAAVPEELVRDVDLGGVGTPEAVEVEDEDEEKEEEKDEAVRPIGFLKLTPALEGPF